MPAPGAREVSTLRLASSLVPPIGEIPSSGASLASGRRAIRLPPALTQLVSIAACASLTGVRESTTTS
jgi:hypothetical protein